MKRTKKRSVKLDRRYYPNMWVLMEVLNSLERLGYSVRVV